MKKRKLLLLALIVSVGTNAQTADRQVLGSSGGSYSSASLSADYTTGEVVTATGSSGTFTISQGFQQALQIPTGIKEKKALVNFSLYPNPAKDQITLTLISNEAFAISISMTNSVGQVVLADQQATKVNQTYKREIPLQALASGVYFVNIYDDKNGLLQSIRFIKQ